MTKVTVVGSAFAQILRSGRKIPTPPCDKRISELSLLATRPAIETRDPDELALRFRQNWPQVGRVAPGAGAGFETKTGRIRTQNLAVIEIGTSGFEMEIGPSAFLMLTLPREAGVRVKSGAREWEAFSDTAHLAEGRPFRIDYAGGYKGYSVLVGKRAFRETAEAWAGEPLPTASRHSRSFEAARFGALSSEIAALEREFAEGSIDDRSEAWMQEVETRFLAALLSTPLGDVARRSEQASPAALGRAMDFMRARYAEPFRVDELARAAGANLRNLQAAFRATLGASPWQYLIMCRLEAVRRALMDPEGVSTVTEAAIDAGFTHLGEFGRLYRERFGERPIDTRGRARRQPEN